MWNPSKLASKKNVNPGGAQSRQSVVVQRCVNGVEESDHSSRGGVPDEREVVLTAEQQGSSRLPANEQSERRRIHPTAGSFIRRRRLRFPRGICSTRDY